MPVARQKGERMNWAEVCRKPQNIGGWSPTNLPRNCWTPGFYMLGSHSQNITRIWILAGSQSSGWCKGLWKYQEKGNKSWVGGWRDATVGWSHLPCGLFFATVPLWATLVLTMRVSWRDANIRPMCWGSLLCLQAVVKKSWQFSDVCNCSGCPEEVCSGQLQSPGR